MSAITQIKWLVTRRVVDRIVVGILNHAQPLVPIILPSSHVGPHHLLYGLVCSLCWAICLWVKPRRHGQSGTHYPINFSPKIAGKPCVRIRCYCLGYPMHSDHSVHKYSDSIHHHCIVGMPQNHHLSYVIHDN